MALQESPRLSFSNDVISPSPTFRLADDDSFSASVEFDFSTSFDVASFDGAYSSTTPADLLFSGGKLLPLQNAYAPSPPQIPDPENREGSFPRSKSVNARGSARSRKRLWKCSSESSAKAYYYSGDRRGSGGNGVRIDPVINVPAPLIPRGGSSGSSTGSSNGGGGSAAGSFFAYLLCNCRGKTIGINEI